MKKEQINAIQSKIEKATAVLKTLQKEKILSYFNFTDQALKNYNTPSLAFGTIKPKYAPRLYTTANDLLGELYSQGSIKQLHRLKDCINNFFQALEMVLAEFEKEPFKSQKYGIYTTLELFKSCFKDINNQNFIDKIKDFERVEHEEQLSRDPSLTYKPDNQLNDNEYDSFWLTLHHQNTAFNSIPFSHAPGFFSRINTDPTEHSTYENRKENETSFTPTIYRTLRTYIDRIEKASSEHQIKLINLLIENLLILNEKTKEFDESDHYKPYFIAVNTEVQKLMFELETRLEFAKEKHNPKLPVTAESQRVEPVSLHVIPSIKEEDHVHSIETSMVVPVIEKSNNTTNEDLPIFQYTASIQEQISVTIANSNDLESSQALTPTNLKTSQPPLSNQRYEELRTTLLSTENVFKSYSDQGLLNLLDITPDTLRAFENCEQNAALIQSNAKMETFEFLKRNNNQVYLFSVMKHMNDTLAEIKKASLEQQTHLLSAFWGLCETLRLRVEATNELKINYQYKNDLLKMLQKLNATFQELVPRIEEMLDAAEEALKPVNIHITKDDDSSQDFTAGSSKSIKDIDALLEELDTLEVIEVNLPVSNETVESSVTSEIESLRLEAEAILNEKQSKPEGSSSKPGTSALQLIDNFMGFLDEKPNNSIQISSPFSSFASPRSSPYSQLSSERYSIDMPWPLNTPVVSRFTDLNEVPMEFTEIHGGIKNRAIPTLEKTLENTNNVPVERRLDFTAEEFNQSTVSSLQPSTFSPVSKTIYPITLWKTVNVWNNFVTVFNQLNSDSPQTERVKISDPDPMSGLTESEQIDTALRQVPTLELENEKKPHKTIPIVELELESGSQPESTPEVESQPKRTVDTQPTENCESSNSTKEEISALATTQENVESPKRKSFLSLPTNLLPRTTSETNIKAIKPLPRVNSSPFFTNNKPPINPVVEIDFAALQSIITTLKSNISTGKNRETTRNHEWKNGKFDAVIIKITVNKFENINQAINEVRSVCELKRNALHFWKIPTSVAEFDALLAAKRGELASLDAQTSRNHAATI